MTLDHAILWMLAPLAFAILLSGLDDLVIDAAWAYTWLKGKWKPESMPVSSGTAAVGCGAATHHRDSGAAVA